MTVETKPDFCKLLEKIKVRVVLNERSGEYNDILHTSEYSGGETMSQRAVHHQHTGATTSLKSLTFYLNTMYLLEYSEYEYVESNNILSVLA